MGKGLLQVGLAVLGTLNTAIPLVLDARSIQPSWPWQYHALIGFFVFAAAMIWMVIDKQMQLNRKRPRMVLGNRAGAETVDDTNESKIVTTLRLLYSNVGEERAYQVKFKVGMAPTRRASEFRWLSEYTSANPIDPVGTLEHGRDIKMVQRYEPNRRDEYPNLVWEWLIFCSVSYSDSEISGKCYEDENWFAYRLFSNLSHATMQQKDILSPFIGAAPSLTVVKAP